jgi:hypothetical protein
VRITEGEVQHLRLSELYTVTYTDEFKSLLVTLAAANDHVMNQSAIQTVFSACLFLVVGTGNVANAVFYGYGDQGINSLAELTFRTLNGHYVLRAYRNGNTCGDSDRKFSNS